FNIKLGLDKTIHLLNHIGNPHKKLKTIHIAGSNGKGSTSSFISSILQEAGFKTGLYTSPHFVRFNERVRINGVEIPDEYIAEFITELDKYVDKYEPTFFELTTALAFKYFYEMKVDYAVIETGLGGRLDATNVLQPFASVITHIGLEHTNILGDTLEKVAYEKACIIKEKTPVFVGIMPLSAEDVIVNKAKENGSNIFILRKCVSDYQDCVVLDLDKYDYNIYQTPLKGKYQIVNAALAVLAVRKIFDFDNMKVVGNGIRNVIKNTRIQGRYEIFNEKPKVIFDSAHNLEGVEAFLSEFEKEMKNYPKRIALFGCMRDKNVPGMLRKLHTHFDTINVTAVKYERAAATEELIAIAQGLEIKVEPVEDAAGFIKNFIRTQNDTCLVVLGSIYLLGAVKEKLI
ncbi:MAG: hypothetical protein A2V66_09760, partial [Ignavibacteria bacterium RBG_13_36_8]